MSALGQRGHKFGTTVRETYPKGFTGTAILIMVAVTATAIDTALATATRLMPMATHLTDMATRATRIRTPTAAMPLAPMPMPDPICRAGTWQRGTSIEPTTSGIDAGIDRRQPGWRPHCLPRGARDQ
jgi:hypothetical protein